MWLQVKVPHIKEYLATACYFQGAGAWWRKLGYELWLTNLGEPAQPEHSWHNISSSSLLLACFTWFCTESSLVFKAHEFGHCHSRAAELCPLILEAMKSLCPFALGLAASICEGCFTFCSSQDCHRNTYISVNLSSVPIGLIILPSPGTFHTRHIIVTEFSFTWCCESCFKVAISR